MNLSNPTMPDELNETTEYTYEVGARSSSGMLAIPDGTQENMLDNQSNNGENDNDGDGISDANDPDDDNDCVPDTWDTSRRDFDGDGIRDHEDLDDDGDGLNDSDEVTDSNSMTNIYDSDNDGYHDCSSFGMYLFDMLDVEVYTVPTMDGNDVIRWDGQFTINASSLVIGETYGISWWLLNADTGYIINSSTANTFTAQSDFQVMYGTWYGMENATYYITAELWYANGSNTSHYHLASGDDAFTIAQTTDFGNSDCNPIALLSNRNVVTGNNQTEFVFGVDEIDLYAYHPCLVGGVYEWNFSISGPNGYISSEWTEGTFFIAQGPDDYDLNVKSYLSQFNPGDYTWTYGLRNSTQGISEWFTHNFTVVDDSGNQDNIHPNCANEYMFESIEADVAGRLDISMVSNSTSDPEYSGNDIIETNFDLCWTPTNESISMIAWLNATDAPYNGPTQGGEQIDRIVYSGFDINHQGHKSFHASHTYSQINAWNYTAAELDSGWYCWEGWLKVYDAEGGLGFVLTDLILWDATCFEVVEEEPSDNETNLLGYCSFPTFEATPTELYSGDDLTFTWTMDGDVSDQVYLALLSGWGTQYYFSSIEDNDGSHTITLPANMNPNADYTIYIESAYNDNRTTLCWKYGSIDILNEGEEPVDNGTGPTQTVDETPRISMWYGKVNQHNENGTWMTDPDGVAGAGLYDDWGDEGWGDRKLEYCQRFWPSTVDVVLRDLPEEIVFYTRGNVEGYLSTKPVWECILEEDQEPVLTGSCTIDLTVTPQEIEIGETLTMEWTMTGDIPSEVRVAVASHDSGMWNVGVQYHVSQHIANTGIFEYVIPTGMNPDRDYVVYVDAVLTDDFTTYCWKYGSFDLLADNEGAIDQVIENLFNTTDRTPRISMWYGKVNQHNENGTWMTDPDGTAGAGNYAQFGDDGWGDRKLEYCQRFWPNTLAVEPMGAEEIVFYTRGNAQAYLTVKPVWQCVHDTDGDGELDTVDVDDDNDGWTDILEQACGTNELDPSDVPTDTDGDQICDLLEEAALEAVEDGEGLPSVGLFATLAVLSVAFLLVSRKELEE